MSRFLFPILLALCLAACGGGGGNGQTGQTPADSPAPSDPAPNEPADPDPDEPVDPGPIVPGDPSSIERIDPNPIEPDGIYPGEISNTGVRLYYPTGISVESEGVLQLMGNLPPRFVEEGKRVLVDAGDGVVEAEFMYNGTAWTASGVSLPEVETVSLYVYVRNSSGINSAPLTITFPRDADWLIPEYIIEGLNTEEFMVAFSGNELRTYDKNANELSRRNVPDGGALHLSRFVSWPATGEVLQWRTAQEGGVCALVAHHLATGTERVLFETMLREYGGERCFPPILVDGATLYIADEFSEMLVAMNLQGQVISEFFVPRPYGELLLDPQSDHLLSIQSVTHALDALQTFERVLLRRINVASGEVTEVFFSNVAYVYSHKESPIERMSDVEVIGNQLFLQLKHPELFFEHY